MNAMCKVDWRNSLAKHIEGVKTREEASFD